MSRELSAFGQVLRHWRRVRGKSQLDLALDAEVSPRHVSFLETGRAQPSRDMIQTLSLALNVPLRERNTLLTAAGYAAFYAESEIDSPALGAARRALELLLERHEPFPAVVMNRRWDIVERNRGAARFFGGLAAEASGDGPAGRPDQPPNVLRMMFHPGGLRPFVEHWTEVAVALVQRVHREAIGGVLDADTSRLLSEVLAYPGVPKSWQTPDLGTPLDPLVPVSFRKGEERWSFFSTVTTLGTAQDVTLQELRVECFHPADAETEERAAAYSAVPATDAEARLASV